MNAQIEPSRPMAPKEIQALLQKLGWSRTTLAASLGLCEHTVWAWTKGRAKPKEIYLRALWELKERADAERKS